MTETVTIHFIHAPSREKRDCFAYSVEQYNRDGGCAALNRMLCFDRGACPFYKPAAASQQQKGG